MTLNEYHMTSNIAVRLVNLQRYKFPANIHNSDIPSTKTDLFVDSYTIFAISSTKTINFVDEIVFLHRILE